MKEKITALLEIIDGEELTKFDNINDNILNNKIIKN